MLSLYVNLILEILVKINFNLEISTIFSNWGLEKKVVSKFFLFLWP